ncbi:glycosyltransferase family 4 protein [Clostridium sp.]|uniref:glycosyltransferase family 4 protein n=1 Tax=Clostridium sp. TaxID=1506 RepID=UPI0032165CAC
MNIMIIGPVNTDKYFGGVAIFTEGLADAFKKMGHEVCIATDYSLKSETLYGATIIRMFNKPSRKNIRIINKIKKNIDNIKPKLIISSLEYGIANGLAGKACKTIHYLHAFPSVKRSKVNNFFVKNITKFISNNSDIVIANSGLTATINSEIFNIKSDYIINVGLGYEFIESIDFSASLNLSRKNKNILFVGRLVKEKNVDCLIKAFSRLDRNDVSLNIVGDGTDRENLQNLAKRLGVNVNFIGKIDPKEIYKYYEDADVFVSLNPHEPYGIVYLEALASHTTILCPATGGQMDTLVNYRDRTVFMNPYDIENITEMLEVALDKKYDRFTKQYIIDNFSYQKVAKEILSICNKKRS